MLHFKTVDGLNHPHTRPGAPWVTMKTYWAVLPFLCLGWLICTIETAEATVLITCEGKPVRLSLELNYRWSLDGGLGAVTTPELSLTGDVSDCSLEALYQRLLNETDLVLKHSTGARADTALIRPGGETEWNRVSDFNSVTLENGMRIWITFFNSPDDTSTQNRA
jgi:hypothetical protein